jgi:hypothetical protein
MPATGMLQSLGYTETPALRDLFDRAVHIHRLQLGAKPVTQMSPDVLSRLQKIIGQVATLHAQAKAPGFTSSTSWQQAVEDAIEALEAIEPEVPAQFQPWIAITISGLQLLISFFPPTPLPAA